MSSWAQRNHLTLRVLLGLGLGLASSAPRSAEACGGFFCNQAQPVNQAAEKIIFADDGEGNITAVIEITYAGPAEAFSWLLPIPTAATAPTLELSSQTALDRLQLRTNPSYQLTRRVEGECDTDFSFGFAGSDSASAGRIAEDPGDVVQVSGGTVGPFDWTVIRVELGVPEPAAAAVDWLRQNDYDVPEGAPALLNPYLEEQQSLLALRLTKGATTGAIRPIVVSYPAAKPSIPVRLTAIAAEDDMGVLTWLLGEGRGVPENYYSLQLNEARINWFNPASNYESVVNEAADDAGGQGFVTEFAGPSRLLQSAVWSEGEEQAWVAVRRELEAATEPKELALVWSRYGGFDGFWEAVGANLQLPTGVGLEDLEACPTCNGRVEQTTLTPNGVAAKLESGVIDPLRRVQGLIDAHPYVTRVYTTLSATEMTVDPVFTFNPDLEDVSNIHTASQVIECTSAVKEQEASWRIELPQGDVVRGHAATTGLWPEALTSLPANLEIRRLSSSGDGKEVEDNSEVNAQLLEQYNSTIPHSPEGCGCSVVGAAASRRLNIGSFGALGLVLWCFRRARR